MGTMASQITSLTIAYTTVYSGADLRKHQSYASLAFLQEFTGDRIYLMFEIRCALMHSVDAEQFPGITNCHDPVRMYYY